MGKGQNKNDGRQGDLFASELYPVRQPEGQLRSADLSLRIKSAMGQALKESPKPAHLIAAEIAEMTGRELTPDALYAFTAPSKPDHDIGICRFLAFVRSTGAHWLIDVLAEDLGLTVLQGREAHFAQRGFLAQKMQHLQDEIAKLDAETRDNPIRVSMRRPKR
jgi:hypothetical protein